MNSYFDGLEFSLCCCCPCHRGDIRHAASFYGVQFNCSGGFYLRINRGEMIHSDRPCVFITHPGVYYEYGNWKTPARSHNFLCFFGPRVERYLETGLLQINDGKPLIPVSEPEKVLELMQDIIALLHASRTTPPRAVLKLEELLLLLHEENSPSSAVPRHRRDTLTELMEIIRNHPEKSYDFDRFAASHGMNPEYFRRLFKAQSGLPPLQFQIRCRMRKAADLLTGTGLPVKEICRRCGIESEFYFSRLFKNTFRVAPGEYRREFPSDSSVSCK